MKQDIKGMFLSDLDISVLKYLYAMKVATYEQVWRDVPSDITQETLGNRIRKLEDNRLVQIQRSRLFLRGKRVISIAKRGFEQFVAQGDEKRVELKSDAMHHDITLVDIRAAIRCSSLTESYQTENEIQTWGKQELARLNSDGVAMIRLGGESTEVPIEYESTMKKESRYEDFLKKYYQSENIPIVLFIADSESICSKVARLEKKEFDWDKPKFFFQLIDNITLHESIEFKNCNGSRLRL